MDHLENTNMQRPLCAVSQLQALQLFRDMELQRIKANDKTYGALAKAFERGPWGWYTNIHNDYREVIRRSSTNKIQMSSMIFKEDQWVWVQWVWVQWVQWVQCLSLRFEVLYLSIEREWNRMAMLNPRLTYSVRNIFMLKNCFFDRRV